jgi:2-furoyl-CoA dehydrogenase FAD binding subunit
MKAPPFAYVRPATVADAVAELARAGDDGKVLAGGQSLVPVLAMRLGRPAVLVDINAVTGLDELSVSDDSVYAGATVRQRQVEQHRAAAAVPLLAMAMPWIGHRELRGRGTVCGSLAHADPAAELPAVAACLNATLDVAGPGGRRTVGAREFFTGPMSTVLAPDELLLGARFPVAGPEDGFGFTELARRHGDFALTGVAIHVRRSPSGEVLSATLAAFGVSGRPVVRDVTPALASCLDAPGEPATELARALAAPMSSLAAEIVDTPGDMHASNGYRRRLFSVLAARELAAAYARPARPRASVPRASVPRASVPRASVPRASMQGPAALTPADARASTRLTVNGEPVTLNASPRLTLADALRDHLGLTGTHLGCEHGICGMCTVLVNGQAARSCLLFACQLEGAEILTVEGLGRPGDLHPLQQAFGRHHALQCGFCTPGFLLSAYDLLTHKPRVTQDELAEELSGVLCRCTGYRNILSAVADVTRAYPDGITGPLNCRPQTP